MDTLLQDIRYTVRSLLRQPSFSLTAILTLALGIGATTAIFSVFNAVLLRPLPFDDPDRIVAVLNRSTRTGVVSRNVSGPDFHDIKSQNQSFAAMGYFSGSETSVTRNGSADFALAYRVTPGFFETLGARPALGRLLGAEDHAPGAPEAAVITHGYWTREFAGDPTAVGAQIKFDDRMFTIAGVLPPGISHPGRADIYYPSWTMPETTSRSGHNYRAVARLRPEVTLDQALADIGNIAKRLAAQYPDSNATKDVTLVRLQETLVGDTRQTLRVLLGAVGLVFLVACANVANLLLARSSSRSREMVLRAAVGAGRGRLIRQLLTESAVMGLAAALLGVWLARLGVLALVAMAPEDLPRAREVSVDATALGVALLLALAASALFGLVPALKSSRVQLAEGLRQGGKGSTVGARSGWARNVFVIAEVALALVLVVGAGLLGRSLMALDAVDMGFDSDRLLVLRTVVPVNDFREAPRATAFYRDLLAGIGALPGVESASAVTSLPTAVRSNGSYWLDGALKGFDGPIPRASGDALLTVVAPDYFQTLGVPLVRGRDFRDGDTRDAAMVAIVNESLATEAFAGQDPVGRLIQCGLDSPAPMLIVGVVRDIRTQGPSAAARAEIYMPYQQHPGPATALNIVVRTQMADPLALADTIRRSASSANPDVPIRATTMEGTLETATATPRFRAYLLIVFAAIALLLASAGVYGVMAYTVSQRIPELGVRIALGATPGRIMKLVLARGAVLAVAGLVIGLALAVYAGRILEGLLFGVTAGDPVILAGVTAIVAMTTFVACYIPGRRAVRVDPMVALRAE